MSETKRVHEELVDKAEKLFSAQEAVGRSGGSERDVADLKILEQQFQAEQQKAERLALLGEKPAVKPTTQDGRPVSPGPAARCL